MTSEQLAGAQQKLDSTGLRWCHAARFSSGDCKTEDAVLTPLAQRSALLGPWGHQRAPANDARLESTISTEVVVGRTAQERRTFVLS